MYFKTVNVLFSTPIAPETCNETRKHFEIQSTSISADGVLNELKVNPPQKSIHLKIFMLMLHVFFYCTITDIIPY